MKKKRLITLLLGLVLSCSLSLLAYSEDIPESEDISKQVDYWISKLNNIKEESVMHGSVPVNQEAYDKLVSFGKPAVRYIVKAIDGGKAENLSIYVILQRITGIRIEHGLKNKEGQEIYLNRIKHWMQGGEVTMVTISGEFTSTKGCMGIVNGTLLTDFANKCNEVVKYEGRIVEVTGYLYEHNCEPGEQCFGGSYMRNIESIKIIQE